MAVRVGINGFGRIGRNIMRAAMAHEDIDFVAVNDLTNAATLAHLLKYDSVLGNLDADVKASGDGISVDGDEFKVLAAEGPGAAAVEGPGRRRRVRVHRHLHRAATARPSTSTAGAKKVIITAPAKGPDITVVLGVNDDNYDPAKHHIISNASCTTNCLAPLAKVIHEQLRHPEGLDDDDPLLHERPAPARPAAQGPAPRPRRGAVDDSDHHRRGDGGRRGAAGAEGQARRLRDARADAERLGGRPQRRPGQEDDGRRGQRRVARSGRRPAQGHPRGVGRPLVSIDFNGNPHSSIVDRAYTKVMDGDFVKVLSWYDNEWGYSSRCVDLLRKLAAEGTLVSSGSL